MKKKRFTEEQIVATLKKAESGMKVLDVCREVGICEQTYYAWKRKYAGMEKSQITELKHLQDENSRLKRLVADLSLDNQALKFINSKNW